MGYLVANNTCRYGIDAFFLSKFITVQLRCTCTGFARFTFFQNRYDRIPTSILLSSVCWIHISINWCTYISMRNDSFICYWTFSQAVLCAVSLICLKMGTTIFILISNTSPIWWFSLVVPLRCFTNVAQFAIPAWYFVYNMFLSSWISH